MEITYVGPNHTVVAIDGTPFAVMSKIDLYDSLDLVYTLGPNHHINCRVPSVDAGVDLLVRVLESQKEINRGKEANR